MNILAKVRLVAPNARPASTMNNIPAVNLVTPSKVIPDSLNIGNYIQDGFKYVCDVSETRSYENYWFYKNIDLSIMFSDHRSWVYFITKDDEIVKIGESGNLLGYRKSKISDHPQPGTKGRISRYMGGDGTDKDIRCELWPHIQNGAKVSFWAKQCPIITGEITVMGYKTPVQLTTHKDEELILLDNVKNKTGNYPWLNKFRK